MGIKHSTAKSFKYAYQGLKTGLLNEPNLRIHFFFAVAALVAGALLRINYLEWIILCFTIFYVITLELLNTVLEEIVDLTSPEVSPHAKIAKDVSAACVLMAAAMSIIVGIILFLPRLITILG